jgi:hypothetical protein
MKKGAAKDDQRRSKMTIARGLAALTRRDLHAFVVDAGMRPPCSSSSRRSGPSSAGPFTPGGPVDSIPQWARAGRVVPQELAGRSQSPGRAQMGGERSRCGVRGTSGTTPDRVGRRANARRSHDSSIQVLARANPCLSQDAGHEHECPSPFHERKPDRWTLVKRSNF